MVWTWIVLYPVNSAIISIAYIKLKLSQWSRKLRGTTFSEFVTDGASVSENVHLRDCNRVVYYLATFFVHVYQFRLMLLPLARLGWAFLEDANGWRRGDSAGARHLSSVGQYRASIRPGRSRNAAFATRARDRTRSRQTHSVNRRHVIGKHEIPSSNDNLKSGYDRRRK